MTKDSVDMAIEALKQPSNATQLLDDGTLKVKVSNVLDIKRVMVMDDNVIYDSYYPDRPKGEWEYCKHEGISDIWKCNQCGAWMFGKTNYCSNCGADMRSEVI